MSVLLEGTLGVLQHLWQSFISSYRYRGHSVDEHECTKDSLISCLFVSMFQLRPLILILVRCIYSYKGVWTAMVLQVCQYAEISVCRS